jgi:hypothetical protein
MIASLPGYIGLAALTGLAQLPLWRTRPAAWWNGRAAFASLLLLTILAAHLPVLHRLDELSNPDESQLIAGAITLREHFIPWGSVDLSTAGPVSVLPLLLAPANYLRARWSAALCAATAIVFCWLALTSPGDDAPARVAALPVAAFFVFMQDLELFQFSTEHMAALLLAGAVWVWLAATAGGSRPLNPWPALGLGVCAGAAVMAKLQSAPCAAWLVLAVAGLVLLEKPSPWSRRWATVAALTAGAVSIPVFFVLLAAVQGVLPDMVHSYVLNNLNYVENMKKESPGFQPAMVWGLNYLLKPTGVVMLACLVAGRSFTGPERRTALLTVGWLLAAVVAVVLPGRGFRHYWFFVLGPVLLASGSLLRPAWRSLCGRLSHPVTGQRWALAGLVLLLLALPVGHRLRASRDDFIAGVMAEIVTVRGAGEKLHDLARPGDTLTVWGWRPELHVYSGLPQGTREAHTQWLIEPIPQRDYYRQRFLADLARTKPRFIADAVGARGFAYADREKSGHETFAALRELISRDYDYLGETENIRLYRRHEL